MLIEVGDRLLVTELRVAVDSASESSHVCRVLAVWGPDDSPSYLVLRYDTGDEELLVPNPSLAIRVLTSAPASAH